MSWKNRQERPAEISVFLSLLLSVLLAFIYVLIQSSCLEAAKFKAEAAMDAGLDSCLSEYSQRLFERFDLLYIDTGYRKEEGETERLSEHLSAYVAQNLKESGRGLVRVSLLETKIREVGLASDNEGGSIMAQAVRFIKEYGEMEYTPILNERREEPGFDSENNERFLEQWDEALADLRNAGLGGNPSEKVREMSQDRQYFLLQGTSGNLYRLSYTDVPSARALDQGTHSETPQKSYMDNEIFVEYLMQKLGCYTEEAGEQALRCELEYILFGKLSDKDNLEEVFDALLAQREGVNQLIFENSPDMIEEAERIAESFLSDMEGSDSARLVDAIGYAWVYAESVIEVNRLLCGGQCSTKPLRSCLILPLEELLRFSDYLGESGGIGLNYKEYLGLMLKNSTALNNRRRFMDVVEMDMRRQENDLFRIDRCVEYIQAECLLQIGYGAEKRIQRAAAY